MLSHGRSIDPTLVQHLHYGIDHNFRTNQNAANKFINSGRGVFMHEEHIQLWLGPATDGAMSSGTT